MSELVKDITHEDVYPKRRVRYTAADFIRAREAAEAQAEGETRKQANSKRDEAGSQ